MKEMKNNFIICGVLGWCMEIIFTSAHCLIDKDHKLMGHTSLWMFPFTAGRLYLSLNRLLRHFPVWLRGAIYSGGILSVEYISGTLLNRFSCCPWNYEHAKYNINGVIRLDYAPFWAIAGLIFEKVLLSKSS